MVLASLDVGCMQAHGATNRARTGNDGSQYPASSAAQKTKYKEKESIRYVILELPSTSKCRSIRAVVAGSWRERGSNEISDEKDQRNDRTADMYDGKKKEGKEEGGTKSSSRSKLKTYITQYTTQE